MKKSAVLTAVVIFLAIAIAVGSAQHIFGITGAVSAVKPEGLGTPTVTSSSVPSAKTASIEIKASFWETFFTNLFGEMNTTDDAPVEETDACCGDARAEELQAQIDDLQAQLDEVKDVQARPCVTVDGITSGTCNAACQNIGMKCYVSLYRRTVDDGTFATEFRPLWVKAEGDCFGDYYMKFPEVYDERDCTCC